MADTKILIVDDEEEFANTLAERMRGRGLAVDTVNNGEDAVETIKNASYDAVILDLAMPGIDGIETLKRMLEIKSELQIILLTGQGSIAKGVEAVKGGAFEFLEKPIKFDVLMSNIDRAKIKMAELSEEKVNDMINQIIKRKGW